MRILSRRDFLKALGVGVLSPAVVRCEGSSQKPSRSKSSKRRDRKSVSKGRTADVQDHSYGKHKLNKFDLWLAKSDSPTPLVVYIHGGGFRGGDKSRVNQYMLERVLQSGISFASINYRLTGEVPYPAQMHDCARAIQYIRRNAKRWNIDPKRLAAYGGSAGSGISQWLAFHDDMAKPKSKDPVERESTRLSCAIPFNAQCTYDPRQIKKIVPGRAYNNVALKLLYGLPEDWNWDEDEVDEKLDALLKDASPINHLTKDDPPVFVYHFARSSKPGNIHHSNFGKHLKNRMDKLGIECVRRMDTDYTSPQTESVEEMIQFLKRHFRMQ